LILVCIAKFYFEPQLIKSV